jgi:AraC-like DNA-binding protein
MAGGVREGKIIMYYPLQIPYILSKNFSEAVNYSEEIDSQLKDFVVCFWEMQPIVTQEKSIENIIVTDGCIDLVADFNNKQIGFVGMSKTNFEYTIETPCRFFGVRMKPGAFFSLTKIPASEAMDNFLPLKEYDSSFDTEKFFALPFEKSKSFMKNFIAQLCANKKPNDFIKLFDNLYDDIPETAESIYERLGFSSKQTQRLFSANFGLTPKVVLSILRFQKCLQVLTSGKANSADVLNLVNFYDQAHFINDFKRNIGLTPFELVRKYS